MIGRAHRPNRRVAILAGVLGIVSAAIIFAAQPATLEEADAAGHARRTAEVRSRAAAAIDAFEALDAVLADAVAEVRLATVEVGRGDEAAAAEPLEAAARLIEGAEVERAHADARFSDVTALPGCRPGQFAAPRPFPAARLVDLAAEIRDAAPLAKAVATVRRHAASTVEELTAAAAALGSAAERPDVASAQTSHARAVESLVAAARAREGVESLMPTADIWFETTERLVRAQGDMIDATLAGDAAAAASAAAAYRSAGAEASLADRALAVGLADASASVLGPPLAELADLRNASADAAQHLRAIADTGTCG